MSGMQSPDDFPLFSTSSQQPTDERRIEQEYLFKQERIRQLKATLKEEEDALEDLEHRVFQHRARRAPVSRMPDEVLLHIFALGSDKPLTVLLPWVEGSGTRRAVPFQVVLSHVCMRWRLLTVFTASLWRNLGLAVPQLEKSNFFQQWLQRSKAGPLRLTIGDKHGHCRSPSGRTCLSYRAMLKQVAPRLLSLYIHACIHTCVKSVLEISGLVPQLVAFQFKMLPDHGPPDALPLLAAPSLVSATLDLRTREPLALLPLGQLRHLECNRAAYTDEDVSLLFDNMQSCGQLFSLHLARCPFNALPRPGLHLSLPMLNTLEVSFYPATNVGAWLNACSFPQLVTLKMRPFPRWEAFETDSVADFEPAQLEHMEVFLQRLDCLATLSTVYNRPMHRIFNDTFMQALARLLLRDAMPNLSELHIRQTPGYPSTLPSSWEGWNAETHCMFLDLLETRRRNGRPLQHFHVEPPILPPHGLTEHGP